MFNKIPEDTRLNEPPDEKEELILGFTDSEWEYSDLLHDDCDDE